jgi:fibronectin-binding autotransporter adhesin
MKLKSSLRNFLILAGSSLLAISSASAQLYWDTNSNTAGFGNAASVWGTSNFWSDSAAGTSSTFVTATTSANDVNFGTATLNMGQGTVTVASGGVTANTITFGAGQTTAITLGTAGNTITLHGGITVNAGSASHNIISPITLAAAQTWTNNIGGVFTVGTGAVTNGGHLLTVGGSGYTRISSAIGGLGGLTKNGANVLMLYGSNGYSGATTINAGALQLGYGGTAGSLNTSSAISIGAGAIFAINRTDAVTQGTTFSNTALSGDGGFSQYGTGTTTLNLANTYKGATTISGGTLSIVAANNLGHADSNLVFNGGLLQITGTALTSFTTLGRTVVFNPDKVVGLDINNAANTFTFDQTLPTAGLMLAGAGTVAFQNSVSALTLNTRRPTGEALTVTYGGAIGNGTGARSVTKTGAGTQILQGNNSYTGATNINNGTLTLSGASGALASTNIGLNGGNLTLDNTTNLGTRISNSATITVNGRSSLTFSHGGASATDYSETIDTLSLQSGFLTFTGSQANATGPRTSNLQFNTLSRSGASNTSTVNFAGTGLGTNARNTIKFGAGVTDATDLGPWAVVNGADFASYSTANGVVASAFTTLASGSNGSAINFRQSTNIASLDLDLNPSYKTLQIFDAGTNVRSLGLNGNTVSVGGISATGGSTAGHTISGTGAVQTLNAGDTLYVHVNNFNLNINSTIQNVGAGSTASTLVKSGAGTLTLGGTNTYTGGTVINAGTLSYNNDARLGLAGSRNITFAGTGTLTGFNGSSLNQLTVNSGAVANISGNNITFGTTMGSGDIVYPGGGVTLNLGNASGFMGNVRINTAGGGPTVQFSNMGDATGSGNLQYAGGSGDGSQSITMQLTGNTGPLTLNNRRIEFIPKPLNWSFQTAILRNDNTSAANKFVINTNLLNNNDRNHNFQLGGANAGDNEFAGVIGNSTLGYMYDGVFGGNNMAANGVLSLIKADGGRWILSGANTYSGATTVSGGTLQVTNLANGGSASSIGTSSNAASNLLLANGTTLRYTGSGHSTDRRFTLNVGTAGHGASLDASGTGAVNFTNTASPSYGTVDQTRTLTLTGTNTGNNTLAATIANNGTGAVSIAKTGIGTWVLSGATNSFSGATTLSGGGKLVLDYTSDTTKLANGAALTLGGGELTLRGGSHLEQVGSLTIGNGAHTSITRDGGTAKLALGAISRAQSAGGTMSLAENSLATTTTPVVNGILGGGITVGSNWAKVDGGGNIIALTAGDYTALPTGTTTATVNYQLTGSQTRAAGASVNSLRISGNGDDQVLTISSGNLQPSSVGIGALGNSGGILYAGGGNNNYTITGAGNIQAQNNNQELIINTFQGTLTVDMALTMGSAAVGLSKAGLGTLILTQAGTYTGATHVNQGALRLRNNTAAGTTAGGIFVQNNAALELANSVAIGAEALTITGNGVSNGGALRNVASNTSSYAGAITVGTSVSGGGARINSDANGTLTLTGGVATSLFNNVTFGGAGNTTVSTAAISGAGGLTKDGAGRLNLSFANTYTGATNVNEGTLEVSGAGSINTSSGITVAAGASFVYNSSTALTKAPTLNGTPGNPAIFSGSGNLGAIAMSLNSLDDVISPGNSPGIQAYGASQTWSSFTYAWELNDWDDKVAGIGGNIDQIQVTGTLDLSGTEYALDILSLTTGDVSGDVHNFAETDNVWTILTTTGGITNFDALEWDINALGFTNSEIGTWSLGLGNSNQDLILTYTAVPEPGAALLGSLGFLLILRRRR